MACCITMVREIRRTRFCVNWLRRLVHPSLAFGGTRRQRFRINSVISSLSRSLCCWPSFSFYWINEMLGFVVTIHLSNPSSFNFYFIFSLRLFPFNEIGLLRFGECYQIALGHLCFAFS